MIHAIHMRESGSPEGKQSFALAHAAEAYRALSSHKITGATVLVPRVPSSDNSRFQCTRTR